MRRIFVIWNPAAGGKTSVIVKRLRKSLETKNIDFQVEDTGLTKSAWVSVEDKLDDSFTDLIIIGGDGTINEAINGLKFKIPVAVIPAGTGDDFVKMVNLGKTIEEHIETAINGDVIEVDLGICNGRKFINGVGIGFDGQIVEDMASKRIPILKGHAAYYYHVLRILGGYREKHFAFSLDGMPLQNDLILLTIGNGSTFGGGFKLMPEAKIDDGFLEICEIGKISGLRRFLNVGRLSKGTHRKLKEVSFHKAKKVSVEGNPLLFAHIDGERLGQPPFEVRVLPKALALRVNK